MNKYKDLKYRLRPSKRQELREIMERKGFSKRQISNIVLYTDLLWFARWLKYLTIEEAEELLMDETCEERVLE